jgi:hypothetical protein
VRPAGPSTEKMYRQTNKNKQQVQVGGSSRPSSKNNVQTNKNKQQVPVSTSGLPSSKKTMNKQK